MTFFKAHATWLASAIAGLVLFLTPSVTAYAAGHPQQGIAVGTVWAIATAWAKSPRQ